MWVVMALELSGTVHSGGSSSMSTSASFSIIRYLWEWIFFSSVAWTGMLRAAPLPRRDYAKQMRAAPRLAASRRFRLRAAPLCAMDQLQQGRARSRTAEPELHGVALRRAAPVRTLVYVGVRAARRRARLKTCQYTPKIPMPAPLSKVIVENIG